MGLERYRRRNGCTCETVEELRDPTGVVCCINCENAPCEFWAQFDCEYWTPRDAGEREYITPRLLQLRKDCLTTCAWSARWYQEGLDDGVAGWRPYNPGQLLQCEWGCPPRDWFAPLPDGDCPFPIGGLTLYVQWRLELQASRAILQLKSQRGFFALYVSREAADCDGEGDEDKTDLYLDRDLTSPELLHLPPKVCLIAANTEYERALACDTKDDQCNCHDGGEATQSFDIEWTGGCDGLEWGDRLVDLVRQTAAEIEAAHAGVTVGSAPCGGFVDTFSLGVCGETVLVVIYCTGSTYAVDFYCYDDVAEEWVSQGSLGGLQVEYGCMLPKLIGTVPELECCCTSCIQDCPDFDTENPTLNVSFYAPGCGTIDGCVQEISNGGSGYTWDATSTSCFSTTTLSKDGANCWKLTLGAAECISATYDAVSVTCDPPEIVFEFTFTPEGTGCCGGATTSVTATVTL